MAYVQPVRLQGDHFLISVGLQRVKALVRSGDDRV